jgi:hypothetical protein
MHSTENIVAPDRTAFAVAEFCYRNSISLSLYHKLKNAGLGPKEMRLGAAIRISIAAEREWQAARTSPEGAEAEAAARAAAGSLTRGRRAGRLSVRSPRHIANVRRRRKLKA